MYPFFRWTKTLLKSSYQYYWAKQALTLDDISEIRFVCNPSDIDHFLEMNNGRILTLFDLGRTDLVIKTGLAKQLLKNRWGLVVAGSSIQYRKRIRLGDEISIKTKLLGIDERWYYIEQTMWVKGQATSHAILRTGITNILTGKVIDTQDVCQILNIDRTQYPISEWVKLWAEVDKQRPFSHQK